MNTEEKLNEVKARFEENLAKAQTIEKQINELQAQLRQLQQPLIEDQGCNKNLKRINLKWLLQKHGKSTP